MSPSIMILFIGIFLSIIIRTFFIINGLDVADVTKLHQMAEAILKGNNPYLLFNFANYPPIGLYIETAILFLSNLLGIPFHILTKILPNLADVITCFVIYKFLIKNHVKPVNASIWSLIYILNPISIIISAAHGHIYSITSLLTLLSIYIITSNSNKSSNLLSAILLGIAIAIKPHPVMLLPLFLVYRKMNLKQTLLFLFISLAPAIIPLIPYLWLTPHQTIVNVFGYSGIYDISYAAILRSLWHQQNAQIWLPQADQMLSLTKWTFIFGAIFLLVILSRAKDLLKSCLAVYLLFIGIYFGISAQYLSWILPLAILTREKMVIPFSIFGTFALLGFYLFFGPEILFGGFWHGAAFQSKYMLIYFVGNSLLWIIVLWWLIKIIKSLFFTPFKTFSPFRKKIVFLSLIVFIISLLPILLLTFDIIKQIN